MKYLSVILLFAPSLAFATAGFAESYHEHKQWIYPAYAYCLGFGVAALFVMFAVSLVCRTKTQKMSKTFSAYLIRHRVLAIIVAGVLFAIPLGILFSVLWEKIWFFAMYPGVVLFYGFPFILVNRRFRKKYMLSPFVLKWTIMISISAIVASILFIVLTNFDMLSGTDATYLARPSRMSPAFHDSTHPYDSIKDIWEMSFVLVVEILCAVIFYFMGSLIRYFRKKLSEIQHRKQKTFITDRR